MSEQSKESANSRRVLVMPSNFHQVRARLWLLILAVAVLTAAWMHAACRAAAVSGARAGTAPLRLFTTAAQANEGAAR
jgi:hypothetical protein